MGAPTLAAPACYSSIQACMLRVARLTSGGVPDPGATNGYISDALIQIGSTIEVEAGDEFTQKNGCGALCVSFKDVDRIKRATLALELCTLDAELIELLTGASLITVGGESVGFSIPKSDTTPGSVTVEAWSKAWDGSQQASDGVNALYWHWVWPSVKWQIGNHTLENGILRVPLTGIAIENDNIGNGPWNDFPAAADLTAAESVFLDDTLPTAACGYSTVPAAS